MRSTVKHQDHQVNIAPSNQEGHVTLNAIDKISNKQVTILLDYAQAGLVAFGLENAIPSEVEPC